MLYLQRLLYLSITNRNNLPTRTAAAMLTVFLRGIRRGWRVNLQADRCWEGGKLHLAHFKFRWDWKQRCGSRTVIPLSSLKLPYWIWAEHIKHTMMINIWQPLSLNAHDGSSAVISVNCWWTFSDSFSTACFLQDKPFLLIWIFMNVVWRPHSIIVVTAWHGAPDPFPRSCLAGSRALHCSLDFSVPGCHQGHGVMEKNRRMKKKKTALAADSPVRRKMNGVFKVTKTKLNQLILWSGNRLTLCCLPERNTS